jgi:hypothetical protein
MAMTAADCATVMRNGLAGQQKATTPAEEFMAWDAALAPFWAGGEQDDVEPWRFRRLTAMIRRARRTAQAVRAATTHDSHGTEGKPPRHST